MLTSAVPDFKFRQLETNGTGQRCSGYFVNLGSQNEVALCQAVDLVSPDLDSGLSPAQENIGVMTLLLSNFPSLVYEIECSPKIGEEVFLFQMMFINYAPSHNLGQKGSNFLSPKGRHSPSAGNAILSA